MFRPIRRIKQQLSQAECDELLRVLPRGVLAVHGEDGYPYAFPMDFVYDGGRLYFHCAVEGHKLDALEKDPRCSFCVMDEGFRREGEWALNIKSVVIFGRIRKLTEPAERENFARKLGLKFASPEYVENALRALPRAEILELTPDHMTGKLVNES